MLFTRVSLAAFVIAAAAPLALVAVPRGAPPPPRAPLPAFGGCHEGPRPALDRALASTVLDGCLAEWADRTHADVDVAMHLTIAAGRATSVEAMFAASEVLRACVEQALRDATYPGGPTLEVVATAHYSRATDATTITSHARNW